MDIYIKRRRGKILLLIAAILIGLASFTYTNWLTQKMELEERNKAELWAKAMIQISSIEELDSDYLTFLMEINSKNTTIPIIVIDESDSVLMHANINYKETRKDEILRKELQKMKKNMEPIQIVISENEYQRLYYRESNLLRNIRLYPLVQLLVIVIFIVVAYLAFSATNRAEQNQVWVGMSKETAHQLGTPISSLMAWIELLKLKKVDEKLITELEQDTKRLERITERFSKIGSKPELLKVNIIEVLNSSLNYLQSRSSDKVKYETTYNRKSCIETPLNAALFSWVIENICKNAIDAMGNEGKITVNLKEKNEQVIIDITDTGIGVAKSHFKTIFQPGYSTKKRGWGLGLSLAKRIVEIYHSGKIFIKWSEPGKGTTFRLVVNKYIDSY